MAELERLSSRLISAYEARCATRARLRRERAAIDREQHLPDGIFSVIADGTLAVTQQGSTTSLLLEWDNEYGQRLLAQGEPEEIERVMWDVAVHGPPGGPDFRGQGTAWHHRGDVGTEHSLTVGGEFRLMRLRAGEHILMFARNDASLCVLGMGDGEALKRTARSRMTGVNGDALHVYLGAERFQLRGVGAAGVLGILESFDGSKLLLGHLTGDHFGLLYVRGQTRRWLGFYDLETLRRGDLGQVLRWAGVADPGSDARADDDHVADGIADSDQADDGERVVPEARQRRPRSHATRSRPSKRPRPGPQRATSSPRATHKARLSDAELALIARHMTPREPPKGPGKTIFAQLLAGIGALAGLGLPNQILRGRDLRCLLKSRLGLVFHCTPKTFGHALTGIAEHTPMVARDVKRWWLGFGDLRLTDSSLMRSIASVTPSEETPVPEAPSPASSGESDTDRPGAPTGGPVLEPTDPDTSQPAPAPEADAADQPPPLDADPAFLAELQRLLSQGHHRHNRPQRRDVRVRTTRGSVPEAESASRWQPKSKRNPRGPPW